jgi:hypothetical protein
MWYKNMAIRTENNLSYGDSQLDLHAALMGYSTRTAYPAQTFHDLVCNCENKVFQLHLNDVGSAGFSLCPICKAEYPVTDSADELDLIEVELFKCRCGHDLFEITKALALFPDKKHARWLYEGYRCPNCSLMSCFANASLEGNAGPPQIPWRYFDSLPTTIEIIEAAELTDGWFWQMEHGLYNDGASRFLPKVWHISKMGTKDWQSRDRVVSTLEYARKELETILAQRPVLRSGL